MKITHYVDLTIQDTDTQEDYESILQGVFSRVHTAISVKKILICLDFPEASKESVGRKIRAMGTPEGLEHLLSDPQIAWLLSRDEVSSSGLSKIPQTDSYVSVKRARHDAIHGKGSAERRIRRLKARAIARGESWSRIQEQDIRRAFRDKSIIQKRAGIRTDSYSSRQSFFLIIDRVPTNKHEIEGISSYGLCRGKSSIPNF